MNATMATMATSGMVTVNAHHFLPVLQRTGLLRVRHFLRRAQRARAMHFRHPYSVQWREVLTAVLISVGGITCQPPGC
jgi:hypothetical protein